MPKSTTPKWAVVATWKRYSLHLTKDEAEEALAVWHDDHAEEGWNVSGSKANGYRATKGLGAWADDLKRANQGLEPLATATASVVKLADHPVCYIGVRRDTVDWLRRAENDGNPLFEKFSTVAKDLSAEWRHVEAL